MDKELGRRAQTVIGVGGRYNVTLCRYCLVALRVAMTQGEFISVGLGVGTRMVNMGAAAL
jgi:hypothetical protein